MFNKILSAQKDLQYFDRPRKVVFYGRVSTEHEEQTYALKNQMQWYDELRKQYPNWSVVDRYIDDGVTGTQAKKRPEFMRMLNDAQSGKFDLIVTREVSRFARNTVECLEFTRQLKSLNVEVYFVHENIWTLDNSGEMILTIMAMVAQEESRKMSERVKAGQAISRKNGVLYGNGNILGYDRVGDTYVINPEQAETVRLIYNLYESGMGMQAIRNELIRLRKKNARGTTEWDVTRISRCLRNTVYKGVMAYNKSRSNNFLDQKTIVNRDEDSYMYVAGKFEPIISSEQWERCKHIRESRKKVQVIDVYGQIAIRTIASHKNNNIWTNKLRCRCGSSMRKNKWHTRHNGVTTFGYKCYSQLNNGADTIRHKEIENFVIIAMYNEKSQIIFSKTGDQFSSPEMDLNDIDAKIVELLTFGGARSVGVYVMHNHPFIYRASPSKADCLALEAIYNELVNIENTVKSIGRNCQITLIDFAIVTEFDYWSVRQAE